MSSQPDWLVEMTSRSWLCGEGAVADEGDAVDLGDLALLDDEDHLHAPVGLVDALGSTVVASRPWRR